MLLQKREEKYIILVAKSRESDIHNIQDCRHIISQLDSG